MAAFAQPTRSTSPPSRQNDKSLRRRALPEGACNFRDLTAGPDPPGCGCRRFWCSRERGIVDSGQQNEQWCICGHHACFHDHIERYSRSATIGQGSSSPLMAPPRVLARNTKSSDRRQENNGVQRAHQSLASSFRGDLSSIDNFQANSTMSTPGRIGARHLQGIGLDYTQTGQAGEQQPTIHGRKGTTQSRNITPFELNTINQPPIPSACLLNSSEMRPWSSHEAQTTRQTSNTNQRGNERPTEDLNGLGLILHNLGQGGRHWSPSPTVPDSHSIAGDLQPHESQLIPSTRLTSANESLRNISPDAGFTQRILAARRLTAALDVNVAGSATSAFPFEDYIQSATEVATPSIANTPDFRGLDRLLSETRGLVETISGSNVTPALETDKSPDADNRNQGTEPKKDNIVASAIITSPIETFQAAVKEFPLIVEHLTPLLTSLQDYLSRNPDVLIHESIQTLSRRMDSLESFSFNHVNPDHLHEQLEAIDGRLMDLEDRADDHGRLIAGFDPDDSHREPAVRRIRGSQENASFTSNQSLASATSSALISAAIHHSEIEFRLKDVEGRIEDLEKVQLPSLAYPWEVEVIFLPWGRELKGIWYPPEELMKPGLTQGSEPWTQTRSARSVSVSLGAGEGGWSDQAIHHWANDAEDWLSPKACGTNGVVYHRLHSRGLVKNITLVGPGAIDIQDCVCQAFKPILSTISGKQEYADADREVEDGLDDDDFMGLAAPFIPLRKVHKSSRLRFLTPPEMVTPTLWSAEFLASGVLMRAPGGRKRLFITTRNAYLQPGGQTSSSWTWQKLRELPRVQEVAASGENGSAVSEADAREPCWAHHPALDLPLSVHSSFASHLSNSFIQEQEMPPQIPSQAVEDADSSHSKDSDGEQENNVPVQPITPMSEFPTQQSLLHCRTRTVSVPLTEASNSAPPNAQTSYQSRNFQHLIPKRRIRSFTHSSNPLIATLPSYISSPSKSRSRLSKRRRLTRSRSGSPSAEEGSVPSESHSVASLDPDIDPNEVLTHLRERVPSGDSIKPLWAYTPQRSKEPHSPFFAESSDAGAGASQSTTNRAVVGGRVNKRGITPSAYATPFSGTIALVRDVTGDAESGDEEDAWEGVTDAAKAADHDDDESMDDEMGYDDEDDNGFSEGENDEDEDDDEMSSEDELRWEGE